MKPYKSPWLLYAPETKAQKAQHKKLTEAISKAVVDAIAAVDEGSTAEEAHETHVMPVLRTGEKFGATDTAVREATFAPLEKAVARRRKEERAEAPSFKSVEFMSAGDKAKVLKAWVAFLKSGFSQEKFSEPLYKHLHLHCSFIAHFDRGGFWSHYFAEPGKRTLDFIDQFDPDLHGISVEYGGTHWLRMEDYADINAAMREAVRPFVAKLREAAKKAERERDLTLARALLAKHGEKA